MSLDPLETAIPYDDQIVIVDTYSQPLQTFGDAPSKPVIHEVSTFEPIDSTLRRRAIDELTPLYDWLEKENLQDLYEVLVGGGYDDITTMIDQMHSPLPITEQMLKNIGIDKPGHRVKLIMKLEEDAGFSQMKSSRARVEPRISRNFMKCCLAPNHATVAFVSSPSLLEWLRGLRLESLHADFMKAGYDDVETLISQLTWRRPLNDEVLLRDVGIKKPGYRNRILSKLKEEQQLSAKKPEIQMEGLTKMAACEMCLLM